MKTILSIITCLLFVTQTEAQTTKSFRTSDGETLYYTTKGKGPKVIFLYGGPGIGAGPMRPWADSLSNNFECIIFDQRGTGLSGNVKLDSTTINLKRATSDLDDLRKHLGENQLTLCGISWGGGLAQAYASSYPEKTKKIILVCSMGPDLSLMLAFRDNMRMRRFPNESDSLSFWNNQPDSDYTQMKRKFFSYLADFYDHDIGYKMLPKFRTIERCGHFPDYEKPIEFFKILREIL
ncbi:MAG: alpha/beta hydrolase [Bacteroidia bacterium]|nr:alpha/beta hydrolase [Bacteroidia bacterium]